MGPGRPSAAQSPELSKSMCKSSLKRTKNALPGLARPPARGGVTWKHKKRQLILQEK